MLFENVSIASVAHLDAPNRITSSDIETQLAETMTRLGIPLRILAAAAGIKARRFWDPGVKPSEVASSAAELAIAAAGIERSRLGVLINTSVCRDFIEPSTACLVHCQLGLDTNCINFDLANACLGFINGMEIVGNMIERGQIEYGIVVDGESSRFVIESTIARLKQASCDDHTFRSNFATLTLGSGAAAMVLGRSDLLPDGHRFIGGVNLAATQHCHLCAGQVDNMVTDTKALLSAGIQLAAQTWSRATQELGWTAGNLDELVLHQVSKVHTEKVAQTIGQGSDHSKILAIYPEFGNIGPASVPIVLSKAAAAGRLKAGNRVALMGIGSGLNCTMAEVVW